MPRADFLSHLERASANPWADLHGYFARTPLCAVREDPVRHGADRNPDAGRDLGLDGARIVHDGSEQARRDIVRFLDRDVLLAGNEAYVRLVGPLAFRGARSRTRFELTRHPRSRAAHVSVDAEVCRLDRIPRYVGLLGGDPGELEVHNGEGWDGLEPGMMGDDDILLMANDIPRRVLAAYSMLEGRRDELGNAAVDALAGLRQQVAGWRLRGMTGSIMEDEVEAALVDALALAKDVRALLVDRSPDLERLVHYIEDFALPCLRDPMPLPEEDVEAMRGLAP